MKRRDLLRVLAGFAMWPSHSREAHAKPIIGFLISRSRDDSARILAGFRRGLAEAGYVDGLDVGIDYRWADGDYEKLPALAADIVRQKPSVLIAAGGEPSAMAARAASDGIPIVFSVGGDPVKSGLVNSLNRPGGNMTGISFLAVELEAKRLGLLHEMAPRAKMIGVLIDRNFEEAQAQTEDVIRAARSIPVGPGGIAATFVLSARTSQCARKNSGSALRNSVGFVLVGLFVRPNPWFDLNQGG